MKIDNEKERLNKISSVSKYASGANGWTTDYSFRLINRFIVDGNALELGPAEGVMTKHLYNSFKEKLHIVEASKEFSMNLSTEYPKAKVINSLFEEFQPNIKYDNIILGHVLEHVDDPLLLLNSIAGWLNKDGVVLCSVPNARSLHRQAAVILGLLDSEDQLNDADKHHGHRRVFNPESFRNIFINSGYKLNFFGGYWLKPLSNKQIEETHTPEMVSAFMQLGERYPDIAAELFISASLQQ